MTTPDTPAAARTLMRQLDDWSTSLTHGSGHWTFSTLSETEDGNGKRRRVMTSDAVDSALIRACHIDGRAFVALWARRAGRKGWTLDFAWRGRHGDEHAPAQITATQLKAYVAAPDAAAALAAITTTTTERKAA